MTRNQFKTPSRVPNKSLPNDCLPVKKELVESPDPRMHKGGPARMNMARRRDHRRWQARVPLPAWDDRGPECGVGREHARDANECLFF